MSGSSMRARCAAALLLGVALLWGALAQAQDPRASAAQGAAKQFLALTDRNDAKGSWESAGKQFRDGITSARWASGLEQARVPVGEVLERALLTTEFVRTFPGAAGEGDYAIVQYRASFAKLTGATESLTLQRESDGVWRVIGYVIR